MAIMALDEEFEGSAPSEPAIEDEDRDSIHTLALSSIPLQTKGLKRARLIKNVRLESRVELYREAGSGSAQINIDDVPNFFGGDPDKVAADIQVLERLAKMQSLDCYSLRRGLRAAKIEVTNVATLSLSEHKRQELFPFMTQLTRPLIKHLYGPNEPGVQGTEHLIKLISKPDPKLLLPRLHEMAEALGTTLFQLPNVLEDFGDMYLSLSYYRGFMQNVVPKVKKLMGWIEEIVNSSHLRSDPVIQHHVTVINLMLSKISRSITKRFTRFDREVQIDWENLSIESFDKVRKLIAAHQASLAEVLCGLTVKISEWEQAFPGQGGSPDKRGNFLMSEIRPGLERLAKIEASAPQF